ncbi:MAG: zf-HC2 domain-containing protein [Anaerolineales bacterium]
MSDHFIDQLPFFLNGTLSPEIQEQINFHLLTCHTCQDERANWEQIASLIHDDFQQNRGTLPSLSPVVKVNLHAPKTLIQAIQSTLGLIWAQNAVIFRGGVLPSITLAIAFGVITSAVFSINASALFMLPLLILVPCIAVVTIALIHNEETDPAYELLLATPTPTAALIFARFSLILGLIAGLTAFGSLLLAFTGVSQLAQIVFVWIGPMLILSGLTTVLVLLVGSLPATGISLTLWIGVVIILFAEIQGMPILNFSVAAMLNPDGWLVFFQLTLAIVLWLVGWKLFIRDGQSTLPLEDRH